MTLPTDIQNALEALQRKVAGQLQSRDEELATLHEERDKIYQQALDLSRQLEDLLRARDVMESELISARLEAKQAQEKLALITDEPAYIASLRQSLEREVELSTRLTSENVDLKLALEIARASNIVVPAPEPEPEKRPAEVDDGRAVIDPYVLAYHDQVTDLPNFRSGLNKLQYELEKAERGESTVAVVVMDIEGLRDLNVYLGHAVTDEVLQRFARLTRPLLGPEDKLFRGRDDEFWLVLPTEARGPLGMKKSAEHASELLKRLYAELQIPIELEDYRVTLSLASGLACSQGRETAQEVLEKALLAVKNAKRLGRGRASAYLLELEKPIRAKMELIPQLRQALNRGQFELRFQPIYDLTARTVKAVESLLRWEHPLNGLIEPSVFLEAACDSGLIVLIGEWVAYNVCHLCKSYKNLHWALNVSAQELIQADFLDRLQKAVESAQLTRSDGLILEVSESHLLHDSEQLAAALKGIGRCKAALAIDDFSFDHLSMKRLQTLGAGYVKLGGHITQNVDEPVFRSLIRGAVLAANQMKIKVVAEGIENQNQLDALIELGVHWGQGYHLCAPVTLEELDEKLKGKAWI
ncbi:MAG: EAL domain-containing protein [Candidatus Eremiobacteraeota bacterium]|nr:EAL domain-containing protein [Candidatus Eremiobacteraeota bacterium]MCW5866851.1 EAL domain-containing protein [Candidatus Eremiobacteraeota bacterium]